jgi:DNA-binding transcriptional ArsR family regulator
MTRALIPNSTQIPDVILDHWMAELSGAELKVLLYIARRTYGFGKASDAISLSQIAQGITKADGTVLDRGTGASRSSVARSLKTLEELGIVVRKTNRNAAKREYEENTYSINLDWKHDGGEVPPTGSGPGGRSQNETTPPQSLKGGGLKIRPRVVSKSAQGWSHNETTVVSKSDPQETDLQETDQETASAPGGERDFPQRSKSLFPRGDAPLAAAALVEELVSHGVGRSTADRLAREKPDTCRRCLDYLPYAKFKTTKGAWLANAIRDEYGPPPGYEKARALLAREQEARRRDLARNAQEKDELAIREQNAARVGSAYQQLEEMQGEAYAAFTEYVQRERARTDRIAQHLSPERRAELLAAFDRPERRLELFQAWINSTSHFLPQ